MRRSPLVLLLFLFSLVSAAKAGPPEPDSGKAMLRQIALDLGSRLRVLSVALRPGYEDLATLAALRMGHGARIVCAFVTNGESLEADDADRLPPDVAAMLRESATSALRTIDATALFWNLPDIAAPPSREYVLDRWQKDTLEQRVRSLIEQYRPDMILIHHDPEAPEGASLAPLLQETVAGVCAVLRSDTGNSGSGRRVKGTPRGKEIWDVVRIWAETSKGTGVRAKTGDRHPVYGRSYASIAGTAAEQYPSFLQRRKSWALSSPGGAYRAVYPRPARQAGKHSVTLLSGVPRSPAPQLKTLDRVIRDLSGRLAKKPVRSRASVKAATALIDSVDLRIAEGWGGSGPARRTLLDWKEKLEEIRAELLGVNVYWRITETVLTERQLTHLQIDSVSGPVSTGTSEVYLPGTGQGWILNEQLSARLPLQFREPFRIISPASVSYDLPASQEFTRRSTVFQPLIAYIIHKGETREENFLKRVDVPIRFAPRFMTEVLTPIVRCMPGEEVRVRFTNNSRDGVTDAVVFGDSVAGPSSAGFRLSTKGGSVELALPLAFRDSIPGGETIIPLTIGAYRVGQFLARQFEVRGDEGKRIGLVSGKRPAAAEDALRRAGFRDVARLDSSDFSTDLRQSVDIVVVDRRAFLLLPWLRGEVGVLREFVAAGGHLLILAQDESSWPENLEQFGLTRPVRRPMPPETPVVWDTSHALVRGPNNLRDDVVVQPVFRAAWHTVAADPAAGMDVVARTSSGDPLLVTAQVNNGRVTYTGLELLPQWMSVQPGALRLLANILSM